MKYEKVRRGTRGAKARLIKTLMRENDEQIGRAQLAENRTRNLMERWAQEKVKLLAAIPVFLSHPESKRKVFGYVPPDPQPLSRDAFDSRSLGQSVRSVDMEAVHIDLTVDDGETVERVTYRISRYMANRLNDSEAILYSIRSLIHQLVAEGKVLRFLQTHPLLRKEW